MKRLRIVMCVVSLLLAQSLSQNAMANPVSNMPQQRPAISNPLPHEGMAPPTPAGFYQNPQLVEILSLTKEQIKALRDIDYGFLTKAIKLRSDLEQLQLAHEKMVAEKNEAEAAKMIDKIAQLHADLFRLHADARTAAAKTLKPEQKALLESGPDPMAPPKGSMR